MTFKIMLELIFFLILLLDYQNSHQKYQMNHDITSLNKKFFTTDFYKDDERSKTTFLIIFT